MEFPFFHGKITRGTCEERLSRNGKNGSYLIRESESVEGALCLCVLCSRTKLSMGITDEKVEGSSVWRFEKVVYTYRIFREHQGHFRIQTSEGVPQKIFKTLKDLIYTFEKPDQGLVINLRHPVNKPKDSQRSWRLKSGKDTIYDEIDDSDYISFLS